MSPRRVPPPKLKTLWRLWGEAVLESLETHGSWTGSHKEALAAAQDKIRGRSRREQEQSEAQGWDTAEGLLAWWQRLRRFDWDVTGDTFTIRVRAKASPKMKRPKAEDPPKLFDEN